MIRATRAPRSFRYLLFLAATAGLFCTGGTISANTGIADNAESVKPVAQGSMAPSFEVRTVDGDTWQFDPEKLDRPVILILFRGGWCPYCNLHLSELRHVIPEIRELGVDILFLSGDRPELLQDGLSTETQDDIAGLDYDILSDADAAAAMALGVAFRVPETYQARLADSGRDIEGSSINNLGVLPVPAVFAIRDDGIVAFSRAIPDYKKRVPPDEVLEVAKSLVAEP